MKLLRLAAFRFLGQAPWSTLTVTLGIMLGVASVSAVHLLSVSVSQSLAAVTPDHLRQLSHLAERPMLEMNDYFALRERWRRGELPQLSGMTPVVEGQRLLGGRTLRVIGVDAFSGLPSTLMLAGLSPQGVLATAGVVESLGVDPASSNPPWPLSSPEYGQHYQIEGLLPGDGEDLLLADIGTAQQLLELPPSALSRIGLRVEHPLLDLQQLLERLQPGFGVGFSGYQWSLPGWRLRTLDSELPSQTFARSVLFNLGALGMLALVVAWLLVYQVGLIWLRRRRRTLQMLELQGVTRIELLAGHLYSLLPLAFAGTGLGVGVGWALALLLQKIATAGVGAAVALPQPDLWLLGKAVASGVGVCMLGGYLAFRRESLPNRLRPLPTSSALVALLLLAVAGVWLIDALWGGFLAIVALSLATMLLIAPLLAGIRGICRRLRGVSLLARTGIRELMFEPQALTVAVAALTLAVASSMAIAIMVDSFRSDFARMLDARLAHDVFVRSSGVDLGPVREALLDLHGVDKVVAAGRGMIRIHGQRVELGYSRFDRTEAGRYGGAQALGAGQALANERALRNFGLAVGDTIPVGDIRLTLVGAFPGFGDALPRLLVDNASAQRLGVTLLFDRLSISATDTGAVTRLLARDYPQLEVELAGPLRQRALEIFDQTFAITRALTLLALLVACIGFYNALLGLKLNQQPVLRLLASMGTSAAELRRVALWRGVSIGAAVSFFALPLGVTMGWLLCNVVNPRAFGWRVELALAPEALLLPLLLGLLVVVLTSLLPAPGEKLQEVR